MSSNHKPDPRKMRHPSEVGSMGRLIGPVKMTPVPVYAPPQVDQPQGPSVRVVTAEEAEELRRLPGERF